MEIVKELLKQLDNLTILFIVLFLGIWKILTYIFRKRQTHPLLTFFFQNTVKGKLDQIIEQLSRLPNCMDCIKEKYRLRTEAEMLWYIIRSELHEVRAIIIKQMGESKIDGQIDNEKLIGRVIGSISERFETVKNEVFRVENMNDGLKTYYYKYVEPRFFDLQEKMLDAIRANGSETNIINNINSVINGFQYELKDELRKTFLEREI